MAYPSIEFNYARSYADATLTLSEELRTKYDRVVTFQLAELEEDGSVPDMEPIAGRGGECGSTTVSMGNGSGRSIEYTSLRIVPRNDGVLRTSGGMGYSDSTGIEPRPMGFAAMIILDGQLLETLELREVTP